VRIVHHRRVQIVVAMIVCVVSWLSALVQAIADENGVLRIVVSDGGSKAAIALSEVDIYGPRSLRGGTGTDGAVVFEKITPGTYEIVVRKARYVPRTLRGIAVSSGKEVVVAVVLTRAPREIPTWLRRIGGVGTKPASKSSTTQTTSDSPEAKLSGSMLGALGSLPSVAVQDDGNARSVSIGGRPANQTLVSIEGVPVSPLGGATNLRPFGLDLFNAVAVNRTSPSGTAAGTVNFDTRNPTLDWIGTLSAVEGPYGNAARTLTEAGTLGRLGVSFAFASRDEGNPLDGRGFLDSSGLDYFHRAVVRTSGEAVKVRYPFSINNILVASAVSINSAAPLFCTEFTGRLPCGYGPANVQRNSLSSVQLRDVVAVGRLNAGIALFHNVNTLDVDQSGLFVDGVNFPQRSSEAAVANGFIVNGQLQVGRGFPLTFNVTNNSQRTMSSGAAFGTFIPPMLSSLTYTNASLSGPIIKRRRFSANLALGIQRDGAQAHPTNELSLTYSPTSVDNIALIAGSGFVSARPGSFLGIADPSSLRFNCAGGSALGLGPSSGAADSTNSRASVTWTHVGRKVSATMTARQEIDFNAPIAAIVSGTALDPALFSPAYLTEVRQHYLASCGPSGAVPKVRDLFYQVTAAVPRANYSGVEGNLHVRASRNIEFDISYGTESARAYGNGGLVFASGSTVIAGRQLPNHPLHTANASVVAAIGGSRATALANLHYVSANNFNNLPSYMVVDAGLELKLQRGAVATIGLRNLTNTHGGTFATSAGAVALPTSTGAFPTIATPLTPHSLNLQVRVPFGPGSELQDVANGDPGPGAYGFRLNPYPAARPADPFAIDRRTGLCGPETAPKARHYLDMIRSYVQRIESLRAASGVYPGDLPMQSAEGLQLHYRRIATTYAVLVVLDPSLPYADRLPIVKPMTGCARMYTGDLPETRERALYISPYDEQQALRPLIDFTPSVGFYIPPSLIENEPLVPAFANVPPAAPQTPFAITTGSECPTHVRSSAEAFVKVVKPYVEAFYDRHENPDDPDGFTITRHTDGGQTWLEIDSRDVDSTLLAACLTIAGIDRNTLLKLKLAGTRPPTVDYAPRLGLYNRW
jgi:hypothetical protein